MTFNSRIWYPIAGALSILNLVAIGFAIGQSEPWHAMLHAGLGAGFGLWAQRLRYGRVGAGDSDLQAQIDALGADLSQLRQELTETQDRLDFTERVLAQDAETRRIGPQQ
jgi:hypothetical protein